MKLRWNYSGKMRIEAELLWCWFGRQKQPNPCFTISSFKCVLYIFLLSGKSHAVRLIRITMLLILSGLRSFFRWRSRLRRLWSSKCLLLLWADCIATFNGCHSFPSSAPTRFCYGNRSTAVGVRTIHVCIGSRTERGDRQDKRGSERKFFHHLKMNLSFTILTKFNEITMNLVMK